MRDRTPSLTDLPESHDAEQGRRLTVYFTLMTLRVIAFLLVLVVPGWWKVLPAVFAVGSSWFAVVIANAVGMFSNTSRGAESPVRELE